jgi:hypothetical protein
MAHIKPFDRKTARESRARHTAASPAWSFDASGRLHKALDEFDINNVGIVKGPTDSSCPREEVENSGNTPVDPRSKIASSGPLSHCVAVVDKKCLHTTMTCDAFKREWRRSTDREEKLGFLVDVAHELSRIFKAELPPSALTDIIDTLGWWKQCSSSKQGEEQVVEEEEPNSASAGKPVNTSLSFDLHLVCYILESLACCGRFSLSLKLGGPHIRACALDLIDHVITLQSGPLLNQEKSKLLACTSEDTLSLDKLKELKSLYTM